MKKPIRVGFDFDGVVAYNPLRIFRAPVTYFKRNLLGVKKTSFTYPKTYLLKSVWALLHETSYFPSIGFDHLKELIEGKKIEGYIISGRYSYLEGSLKKWLRKYQVESLFSQIIINRKDEQPHLFKEMAIKRLELDVFVEDNWDIVEHLTCKTKRLGKTKIFWIYNIFDRFIHYPHKYPSLKSALRGITKYMENR